MSKQKNILCLLSENEEKIAELYRLYAEKIRGRKRLWKAFAKEEDEHAEVIRSLDVRFGHDQDSLKVNKHAFQIVDYISRFIDEEILKAKKREVTHWEALESALRIEQSMVENKSFEIFKPINKAVTKVFRALNRETKGHVKDLRKMSKG